MAALRDVILPNMPAGLGLVGVLAGALPTDTMGLYQHYQRRRLLARGAEAQGKSKSPRRR